MFALRPFYGAALYRRIRSRNGHQSIIIAVAHYLLVVSYQLLRDGANISNWAMTTSIRRTSPKWYGA
jgi:hypothetical protein